jgi:glutathione reductase (NADPH)
MPAHDYDLFVVGAGSGGVRAARIAAKHGAKVAIAEELRVGGTCVIRGCVPKKLLVYASRFADDFEDAAGFGWTVPEPVFDWASLIAAKDKEIARLESVYRKNLVASGVQINESRAVIEDPHTVRLLADGRRLTARVILVATGAAPNLDVQLPGIEHVITSNEAFHLKELPRRIVVAGGGYVAVEFAGIFAGLGADTTLLYRGEEILRGFDDDLRKGLHAEYERRGIRVVCGQVLGKIERTPGGLTGTLSGGETIAADQIMLAIGRSPNTADLGLEQAGVKLDKTGAIVVDAFSQTSTPSIYAVGDVTNRVNLTPVAIREGHAFADTVFGGKLIAVDHTDVPSAVFSTPEIGTVGLTEAEARKSYAKIDIYKSRFRPMRLTLTPRQEWMLMKLVVDGTTDRVLGVHIMGPDAGEMAQLLGIAIKMGARKSDLDATIAVHPTAAEELVTMQEKWTG